MSEDRAKQRSVRMSEEEAWSFLEAGRTGIFTTLRRDGMPIAMPVWYVTLDRRIYISTRGKKLKRVANDPRSSFLVEAGERWAELQAVHLTGRSEIITPDDALQARIAEQMGKKYDHLRSTPREMPTATKDHYRKVMGAIVEFVPDERLLTWDNNHLTAG